LPILLVILPWLHAPGAISMDLPDGFSLTLAHQEVPA